MSERNGRSGAVSACHVESTSPATAEPLVGAEASSAAVPGAPGTGLPRALLLVGKAAGLHARFSGEPFRVLTAASGGDGLALLSSEAVCVVVTDQRLPDMAGSELLRQAQVRHPGVGRVVLSEPGDFPAVAAAIEGGLACQVLPASGLDVLLPAIVRAAFGDGGVTTGAASPVRCPSPIASGGEGMLPEIFHQAPFASLESEKALRASEHRFSLLFEFSPVPLGYTPEQDDFATTIWNKAWFDRFGYPREAAQGKGGHRIGLWVVPGQRNRMLDEVSREGSITDMEVRMWHHDGTERIVIVRGRMVDAGEDRILLTAYEDVTELRAREKAVLELNSELEVKVAERTQALSEANAQLSANLETLRRAQFELLRSEKLASLGALVAGVAHELSTPIGNCRTVASALEDKTLGIERRVATESVRRSELMEYLAVARDASSILLRNLERTHELVGNFKQVAVDQASENRRKFDLAQLCSEILSMLQPTLKRLPYRIAVDIPERVILDSYPGPLGTVLGNLINNSVQHAFEGRDSGTIRIAARQLDGEVELTVADDGRGMTPYVRAHAFDPFFTTRLGHGGSGLGLYLAFNLVTGVLGGEVGLETAPESGSRFVLRFPLIAPTSALPPPIDPGREGANPPANPD